jgi:DNA polymerase alpha subunit A
VVDDGVSGYMDNGMDDWTGRNDQEEDLSDEEQLERKKKCTFAHYFDNLSVLNFGLYDVAKKARKDDKGKYRSKPKAPPPPTAAPSINAYRPVKSVEQEDDFMSSILGTMDQLPPIITTSKSSRKRKQSPDFDDFHKSSSPDRAHRASYRKPISTTYGDTSSDGLPSEGGMDPPSSDDYVMSPKKKVRMTTAVTPATERMSRLDVHSSDDNDTSFDDLDMNAFMDVDDDLLDEKKPDILGAGATSLKMELDVDGKPKPLNGVPPKKQDTGTPAWLSIYDSLTVTTDDTLGPLSASSRADTSNSPPISALEPDGSLRFFWLDYIEINGILYFIGKLRDKTSLAWVSCCITVSGIQRNLFVLPREKRVEQDEDGDLCETDVIPERTDVYSDFDTVRRKVGIKKWKAKFVKRKYAFGEKEVPMGESEWLKVVYGFDGNNFLSFAFQNCRLRSLFISMNRATNTRNGLQSQLFTRFWHQHQCFRASRTQTEDHGSLLASDKKTRRRS